MQLAKGDNREHGLNFFPLALQRGEGNWITERHLYCRCLNQWKMFILLIITFNYTSATDFLGII